MQKATFGRDLSLPAGESRYLKLKNKGDALKFRIAGTPAYQTDHWVGREKTKCLRYGSADSGGHCDYCEQYELAVEANDEERKREYRPVTTFLYPVLNRESGHAAIFQFTAPSIHYRINDYAKEGVDVFACDWRVVRTEEPGSGYYSVMRLGEDILKPSERDELAKAGKFDLAGRESKTIRREDVDPDELPEFPEEVDDEPGTE